MNVVSCPLNVPVDYVNENIIKLAANELFIIGVFQICADCLEEPECCVHSVVFWLLARVRESVRQHSKINVQSKLRKNASRDFGAACCERQPGKRNHCVASPIGEPMVASNDSLLLAPCNYE